MTSSQDRCKDWIPPCIKQWEWRPRTTDGAIIVTNRSSPNLELLWAGCGQKTPHFFIYASVTSSIPYKKCLQASTGRKGKRRSVLKKEGREEKRKQTRRVQPAGEDQDFSPFHDFLKLFHYNLQKLEWMRHKCLGLEPMRIQSRVPIIWHRTPTLTNPVSLTHVPSIVLGTQSTR